MITEEVIFFQRELETTFFFFYAPFTKSSQRARRQVVIKAIPKIGIDKLMRIFQCKVLSLSANAF